MFTPSPACPAGMGPALGASCTWVWIRFRPRNHRIWPRLSSRSAWSISSTSSLSSSSGISSFCVSLPASLRNLSLLVGMVAMTCRGCGKVRAMGAVPQSAPSLPATPFLLSQSPASLTQLPLHVQLINIPIQSLNLLLICLSIHSLIQSQGGRVENLGF